MKIYKSLFFTFQFFVVWLGLPYNSRAEEVEARSSDEQQMISDLQERREDAQQQIDDLVQETEQYQNEITAAENYGEEPAGGYDELQDDSDSQEPDEYDDWQHLRGYLTGTEVAEIMEEEQDEYLDDVEERIEELQEEIKDINEYLQEIGAESEV